ncbi:MAG: alpha-L-rhamnosidase [Lentisphaeria bacterium]
MSTSFTNFSDDRVIDYLSATRIILQEGTENSEVLLQPGSGQASTRPAPECRIEPGGFVLLDFGREIQGGLRFVTGRMQGPKARIRVTFGESVSEACSHPDYWHALQETTLELPHLASTPLGELGFRFARLENLESERSVFLREVMASFQHRKLQRLASFECSNPQLNQIWETAVYTLELCLQNYVWDGIKRDRLVWMGDLYPELLTAGCIFGRLDVVERSLDFLRQETPLPAMMNGCYTYSIWWILAQYAWFRLHGHSAYLEAQREYLTALLKLFASQICADGQANFQQGWGLLDWATGTSQEAAPAILAGNHALLLIAFRRGAELCRKLGEIQCAEECECATKRMAAFLPPITESTAANAFQVLAGLRNAKEVYKNCFAKKLPGGLSTFLGSFVLDACVLAGQHRKALAWLSQYWGTMLEFGATTFWEHFDLKWTQNAARIDEPVPPGKRDIHRDSGEGCYQGFRHSLCHGWASLPAVWLQRHVLGVEILAADQVSLSPRLSGLAWARGSVYTPFGPIEIEVNSRKFHYSAPPEINIVPHDFLSFP